jgi:hypothetical protein
VIIYALLAVLQARKGRRHDDPQTVALADLARTAGSVSSAKAAGETSPGKSARDGGGASGSARKVLLDPRAAAGCRIAMGVTMAFMLIIMI